jgi:epoxyqueuosine reductase QueG
MNIEEMVGFVLEFQENDPNNRISIEVAKNPDYIGRKIFEGAICGVAAADDPVIVSLKENKAANIDLIQPTEWLPGAKSVVSFFLPFARWIVEENQGGDMPSDGWLHGRIEGQMAMNKINSALAEKLREEGHGAICPSLDPRLKTYTKPEGEGMPAYTSNWSERHIAYAAGLGTFGLSHGIITELGTAGRLISLVTTLPLTPVPRPYTDLREYCSKCGACIRACPVKAISMDRPKDHAFCDEKLEEVKKEYAPYYGCGKCQSGMPCAYYIPNKSS